MGMYPLSLLESRVAAQGMELCIDSRKATPGCVFVALPGSSADGSQFIADAVARGAGYVVCRPESAGNCGEAEVVDCADPLGCWPAPGTARPLSRSLWSA